MVEYQPSFDHPWFERGVQEEYFRCHFWNYEHFYINGIDDENAVVEYKPSLELSITHVLRGVCARRILQMMSLLKWWTFLHFLHQLHWWWECRGWIQALIRNVDHSWFERGPYFKWCHCHSRLQYYINVIIFVFINYKSSSLVFGHLDGGNEIFDLYSFSEDSSVLFW